MQGDIQKAEAMSYEQQEVADKTGSVPLWTSSMFSGMPGYQIATPQQKSVFTPLKSLLIMRPLGLERNIGVMFLYLIGFYVCLLALGVSPWLAAAGAIAFGLGSYNIIIIEAGHITKAWAMAMMAPIVGGIILTLRGAQRNKQTPKSGWGNIIWGFILFTLALGLQITFNHIQITYYTILIVLVLGVVYLIYSIKDRWVKQFALGIGILVVGCALAFACNMRHLLVNNEYAKYTMRGGNDITVTAEDLYHDGEPAPLTTSNGLERDYAFSWSYGIDETMTLLIPGAKGGGSNEQVGHDSESYKNFRQDRMPLYWGDQPFTSGPVYFGAIIVFLFVVGLFVVRGPERWWLLLATLLAIAMSWGKNFMGFNEFLFNHLPYYNKFRTPSMSLVIANVTMVIMAILAVKEILSQSISRQRINRALYWSTGIVGGVILIVLLMANSFSYSGAADTQMAAQYGNQWNALLDIFVKDRKHLLVSDAWRSLLFILLAAVPLWLYNNQKIKQSSWCIGILALLTVIDLWGVDRRYLNESNFVDASRLKLRPDQYDYDIDQQAATNGDQDYRVFNMAVNTFNDSKPSAFHHQIGGYSAAKLRRYQDLIDFYLSRHISMPVLNMLNTRYFVLNSQQGPAVQRNPNALGNAWFVDTCRIVADANAEILALNDFNPATTAIIDSSHWSTIGNRTAALRPDSTASISMEHADLYNPDYLVYHSHSTQEQVAVFSEIYYAPDWRAYIDGQPAEYFRANYVLRAMIIPAGDHVIEFKNEAPLLHRLDHWTVIFSIILVLIIVGMLFVYYKKVDRQSGVSTQTTPAPNATKINQ